MIVGMFRRDAQTSNAILNLDVQIQSTIDGPLDTDSVSSPSFDLWNSRLYKTGIVARVRQEVLEYIQGACHVTQRGFVHPGHVEGVPTIRGRLDLADVRPNKTFHLHTEGGAILDFTYGQLGKPHRAYYEIFR